MTLEAHVVGEDALRAAPGGYELDLHLAWYRSLPLSCLENLSITVAGRTISRDDLRVLRDGRELTLDQLADRIDDEWFVQDPLTVACPEPSPLPRGSEAEIDVTMKTRIPYIVIGPEKALVKTTQARRKLVIR